MANLIEVLCWNPLSRDFDYVSIALPPDSVGRDYSLDFKSSTTA